METEGYGYCYLTGTTFIGFSSSESSEINPFLAGFYGTFCFVAIIGLDSDYSSLSSKILRFFCCWIGWGFDWNVLSIKGWLLIGVGLESGPFDDPNKGLLSFDDWIGNGLGDKI